MRILLALLSMEVFPPVLLGNVFCIVSDAGRKPVRNHHINNVIFADVATEVKCSTTTTANIKWLIHCMVSVQALVVISVQSYPLT